MKFFSLATLMLVSATEDLESSSLLQSKKDSINRVDLVSPVLDRAAASLRGLMPETDVEDAMSSFAAEMQASANSVIQLPTTEKAALLQRASQTKELSNFVQSYVNLPTDIKKKVDEAALATPIMNQIYDTLAPADSHALLIQLDRATTGKRCFYRTGAFGQRVRECTTTSQRHTHRHWHGDRESGTETTTRDKDGNIIHRHTHGYTHNGEGGNANTDTTTLGKDSYRHGHGHSHRIDNSRRTFTSSASDTTFHGGDNAHSHNHGHDHRPGGGTNTNTFTRSTEDGRTWHAHGHTHSHDERDETNGNSRTSSTFCDGPNPNDCKTIVTN